MDQAVFLKVFQLSSLEQLSHAETALLDLEAAGGQGASATVEAVFRTVHTVKGDAATLELSGVVSACHVLEGALHQLRQEDGSTLGASRVSALLGGLDRLRRVVNDPATPVPDFSSLLDCLRPGFQEPPPAAACAPSGQDSPEQDGHDAHPGDSGTLAVQVRFLDDLLDHTNEIMMLQSRLMALAARDVRGEYAALGEELRRRGAELGQTVLAMRTMPLKAVVPKYRRLVRDLGARMGKDVELRVSGETTELDKSLVEKLNAPLVHLLRNAVHHGIEAPGDRARRGKPARGGVRLDARQDGGEVLITLEDDGAGIDAAAVLDKARAAGMDVPGALTEADAHALALDLVFRPGLSTAERVDDISGRGVGLDAVRADVSALGGGLEAESERGRGTRFILRLPVALTVVECLSVRVGGDVYFLPLEPVLHCLEDQTVLPGPQPGFGTVGYRDRRICCVLLDGLWGRECPDAARPEVPRQVAVLSLGGDPFGVAVDQVLGLTQVMVKRLDRHVLGADMFLGAAVNDQGGMSLILDPRALLRLARDA
uniref:histidine kinase n=1 Tax=Fundidesulfovibrio putealis TaxID=270496 RepID=A0A7C4ENH5_9BACT